MKNIPEIASIRERQKQAFYAEEISVVINRARALVKYRGQSADEIFKLKMNLANALAHYDSMTNKPC